ncbi:MAG: histidinol-phosphate transaminase [Phascolarctobacterium sp.]|nr:histidinol-phosphate transaminase [Phascolarctobacterium sp.]
MSRFFSKKYDKLVAYVPGEQPRDRKYIKLNTNENPYPPSPLAQRLAREVVGDLYLYSDPTCKALTEMAVAKLGVKAEEIMFNNSSDESLNFAFMAFCDKEHPAVFADITYGFNPVFADLNNVPYRQIPLKEDFSIDVNDYFNAGGTVFIANPNAITGLNLSVAEIEKVVAGNPNNVVVIDEAYVDFGGETVIPLIRKYNNLVVIRTFSKSRSLAGARLGCMIACPELIQDLQTLRYSTNPYNVNTMTMAAGVGALADVEYFQECCEKIKSSREYFIGALRKVGYKVVDSCANFVLVGSHKMDGEMLYTKLKENGVVVRFWNTKRLAPYVRISIGTREDMETCAKIMTDIQEGKL